MRIGSDVIQLVENENPGNGVSPENYLKVRKPTICDRKSPRV